MGRTNPTFRAFLDSYEAEWRPFRRALRRRHRPAFDRLFEHARGHAAAASHCNRADPETAVLVAVLLAHERELERLRTAVADGDRGSVGHGGGAAGGAPDADGEPAAEADADGGADASSAGSAPGAVDADGHDRGDERERDPESAGVE